MTSGGKMNLPNKFVLRFVISCSMFSFIYAKNIISSKTDGDLKLKSVEMNLGVEYTSNLKSETD